MKKISIDHMSFEGKDEVLKRLNKEVSLIEKIKNFMNREVEIPVAGFVVSLACWFVIIGATVKVEPIDYPYTITVIEAGGQHEIY